MKILAVHHFLNIFDLLLLQLFPNQQDNFPPINILSSDSLSVSVPTSLKQQFGGNKNIGKGKKRNQLRTYTYFIFSKFTFITLVSKMISS